MLDSSWIFRTFGSTSCFWMDTSGVRGLMRTVPLPGPSILGRGERHRFSCSCASDNRIQPPSCCQRFSPGFVDVVGWKGQWSIISAFLFTFLFIKLNTIDGGLLKVLLLLRMMQHCDIDLLKGCRGAGCSLRVLDFSEKDPHVMSSALSFHSHIPIISTVLGCYLFLSSERETVQCCAGHTESESEVAQSCLTLCNCMDCSLPGSSVHGIFQARILEWVAISFSRRSSPPRDRTRVSCIVDRLFIIWATREVLGIQKQHPTDCMKNERDQMSLDFF